jgi:hypothetical protein
MSIQLPLRRVLLLDAVVSGACGLLMVLGAGTLGPALELPPGLLRWAGAALLPFAAAVGVLATRPAVAPRSVLALVAVNAAWVVASVAILLAGVVRPNALGVAFVVAQALVVALFAELQYAGLRRTGRAAAAA